VEVHIKTPKAGDQAQQEAWETLKRIYSHHPNVS
jgi:hypothetical protein